MPGSQIWCGGRWWTNYQLILDTMREEMPDLVIEGEQRGADLRARAAAESLGIPVDPMAADWRTHGRAAGAIRNRLMLVKLLQSPPPHKVVAFHTDITASRGTADMLRIASKAKIPYRVVSGLGVLAIALIMAGGCIPRPVLWPKPGRSITQMTAQEVQAFDQGRESAETVPRGKFVNVKIDPETGKQIRGFAAMKDKDKAKDIQSRGGKNAHANGTAYVFGHKTGKKAGKLRQRRKRG
jgi:hypothetical protein